MYNYIVSCEYQLYNITLRKRYYKMMYHTRIVQLRGSRLVSTFAVSTRGIYYVVLYGHDRLPHRYQHACTVRFRIGTSRRAKYNYNI